MKNNWLGIIKSAVLLGLVTACVLVSAKDVKASGTTCGCGKHEYEISGDTITIKNKSEPSAGITADCIRNSSLINSTVNKVVISEGVPSINRGAFSICPDLKSISIPSSVTTIVAGAFEACTSLTSVTINGSGLTTIENSAFAGCKELTSITIPDSVSTMGNGVFGSCEKLTSINIPRDVDSIPENTFAYCKALTSITIPANVKTIKKGAFEGCTGLTSIVIPSTVETIGQWSFLYTSPASITIEGNPTSINSAAFDSCNPSTVIFTEAVNETTIKSVINSSNLGSSNLTSIVVPDTKLTNELLNGISDNSLKSKIKTQTTYEAEKNAKPASNDTNKDQKTASEGTPTGPSKSVYEEKMDSLIKDISAAESDAKKSATGKKTIYLKDVTALSLSAMKAIKSNPNVNLDMTYTYKGVAFHIVIPGGTAIYDESIPWYGPLWLYAKYGQGKLTDVSNNANVYIVQKGDTLRKIAAKYGMTLDELIKKNPQIKNIDKISIGDKINL